MIGYTIGQFPLMLAILYQIEQADDPSVTLEAYEAATDFGALGMNLNLSFLLLLFMFVVAFIVLYLCITRIHNKNFQHLITPRKTVNKGKILFGFLLWLGLAVIAEAVLYFQNPGNYIFDFNLTSFISLLLIALFILPIQTLFEEVFFRGYLMQGFSLLLSNKWMPLVITSLLFGLVHISNPEIKAFGIFQMEVYYITAAIFLGIITILDDSLELAIGVHTATNFYGATLVSYNGSVLQTHSIMKSTTVEPITMTLILIVSALIFVAICYKKYKWPAIWTILEPISFQENNA